MRVMPSHRHLLAKVISALAHVSIATTIVRRSFIFLALGL
jgi:hypothetical protein